MGATPLGHDTTSQFEYKNSSWNNRIQQDLPPNYFACQQLPLNRRTPILLIYQDQQQQMVVAVHSTAIQAFDIQSGQKKQKGIRLQDSTLASSANLVGQNLILAMNTGKILVVDPQMLFISKEITPQKLLPGLVSVVCGIGQHKFACGHTSGGITIWSAFQSQLTDEFHAGYPPTAITCMQYSEKFKSVVVGFDNVVRGMDPGRTEKTSLKIFGLDSERKQSQIKSLNGKCVGLKVVDSNNIVVALSGNNHLGIWDLLGGFQLIDTQVPEIVAGKMPSFLGFCQTCIGDEYLIFGFSGAVLALAELFYDGDQMKYTFRWRGKSQFEGGSTVVSVFYSSDFDSIFVGDSVSAVRVLNNISETQTPIQPPPAMFSLKKHQSIQKKVFTKKKLPFFALGKMKIESRDMVEYQSPTLEQEKVVVQNAEKPRVVNEETLEKIRQRVQGRKASKETKSESKEPENTGAPAPRMPTPFQRFLQSKKGVILQQNPNLTYKQVIMQVTTLWAALTEQDKQEFECTITE